MRKLSYYLIRQGPAHSLASSELKRVLLRLILLWLFVTGCIPNSKMQVEVNGTRLNNLMLAKPKHLSICVTASKKNIDPFYGDEVCEKIQKLLLAKDYTVTCDRPDFYCTFSYGISSSSTLCCAIPVSGLADEKNDPNIPKLSKNLSGRSEAKTEEDSFIPYSYAVSGCYLILELHNVSDFEQLAVSEPLWVGKITSYSAGSDLIVALDYMLIAATEHFTENTEKPVTESMSLNDRRVKSINQPQ